MISLGTSTTALVITKEYKPSPQYHVFAHPEDRGMYMGMLCYSNGALAREQVRDKLNQGEEVSDDEWEKFTKIANTKLKAGQVLGINSKDERAKLGIYFLLLRLSSRGSSAQVFEWSKNRGAATSPTARVLKGLIPVIQSCGSLLPSLRKMPAMVQSHLRQKISHGTTQKMM